MLSESSALFCAMLSESSVSHACMCLPAALCQGARPSSVPCLPLGVACSSLSAQCWHAALQDVCPSVPCAAVDVNAAHDVRAPVWACLRYEHRHAPKQEPRAKMCQSTSACMPFGWRRARACVYKGVTHAHVCARTPLCLLNNRPAVSCFGCKPFLFL
eukprot:scaffold176062_cov29-Tisochrysis_lutea.AAC.2